MFTNVCKCLEVCMLARTLWRVYKPYKSEASLECNREEDDMQHISILTNTNVSVIISLFHCWTRCCTHTWSRFNTKDWKTPTPRRFSRALWVGECTHPLLKHKLCPRYQGWRSHAEEITAPPPHLSLFLSHALSSVLRFLLLVPDSLLLPLSPMPCHLSLHQSWLSHGLIPYSTLCYSQLLCLFLCYLFLKGPFVFVCVAVSL